MHSTRSARKKRRDDLLINSADVGIVQTFKEIERDIRCSTILEHAESAKFDLTHHDRDEKHFTLHHESTTGADEEDTANTHTNSQIARTNNAQALDVDEYTSHGRGQDFEVLVEDPNEH